MDNLKEAPIKFEDTKSEVTDLLEEINLGSPEELRVTYIGFFVVGRAKGKGSPHGKRVQKLLCLEV